MEDSHLKELLRESVLPVILQNGLSAHRLSMRIFRRYKIVSLLCGNRKSLLDTLDLSCGFMRLFRTSDERIAAEQLCDLADEYRDCTFVLIPLSKRDRAFTDRYSEQLESRFIISAPDGLFSRPPFFDTRDTACQ